MAFRRGARTGAEKPRQRSTDETAGVVEAPAPAPVEQTMQGMVRRRERASGVAAAWLACALLCLCGAPARGIVYVSTNPGDNGSGNTTPPTPASEDPGFDHVGVTGNGLTGVYLGNRWVLTAGHVGEQSLTLGGVTYPVIAGSRVQLQHSPGVLADLALERLLTTPPLAPLVLASSPPVAGTTPDTVTMIGYAWDRESSLTCWDSSFAVLSCGNPFVVFRGYRSLTGGIFRMRWGRNRVAVGSVDESFGGTTTRAFQVNFDQSGINYEAQAVPGDSGGAVFVKRGGQWQLLGVMFAILIYPGQPYYSTVVFGQGTLSADVSFYRSQILSLMNPPPEIPALPWAALALAAAVIAATAFGPLRRGARARAPGRGEAGPRG